MELGKKVSFSFNAVVAGQKSNGNNNPQLIANSTAGKFTITAPVSKAMGIAVGEYVQFVHNMNAIEQAINEGNDDIKNAAQELQVDLTTREGQLAVIEAFTQWGIIKGRPMLDKIGNPVMVSARLTEEEKRAYLKAHASEVIEALRDTLIERVGNEEATDEELFDAVELDDIEYPKVPGFTGSKTASTSAATGVGLQLGFTDSSVWKQLKKDLGDDAVKKNRIFKVLLDTPVKTNVDGEELVVYPIEFDKDVDPIVRGEK